MINKYVKIKKIKICTESNKSVDQYYMLYWNFIIKKVVISNMLNTNVKNWTLKNGNLNLKRKPNLEHM